MGFRVVLVRLWVAVCALHGAVLSLALGGVFGGAVAESHHVVLAGFAGTAVASISATAHYAAFKVGLWIMTGKASLDAAIEVAAAKGR